jgi:amino acid transporter
LALIYQRAAGTSPILISAIAMAAVVNGALIQMIMGSRVCYGLARQGWIPATLGQVHPRTRTPVVATLVVSGSVLVMALWLPVETLARVTSLLLLVVFALINLALWKIQRNPDLGQAGFSVPHWIPVAGFATAVAFLSYQLVTGVLT